MITRRGVRSTSILRHRRTYHKAKRTRRTSGVSGTTSCNKGAHVLNACQEEQDSISGRMPCGVGYYKNVGLSDDLFTAQARLRLLSCTAWKAKFGKPGFLSVINRSILHLRAFLVPGISRLPLYVSPLTPTDRAMAVCFMALSSLGRSRRGQTVR